MRQNHTTYMSVCLCVRVHPLLLAPPSFLLLITSMLPFFRKHEIIKREFLPRDRAGWAAGPSGVKRGGEYLTFFPSPIDVYVWAGHSGGET